MVSTHSPAARRPRGSLARKTLRGSALLAVLVLLGGCNMVLLNPAGDVAVQQRNLIIASTALMLLVIVPVIALTFLFAWRYRASNPDATYDPDWHHSTQLEVVIWTVPLLIIIALGAMTWVSTHTLDPFRPLSRIAPNKPVTPEMKTLKVEVVALDWKWLFIYPELGVASVNELAMPTNVPVSFRITSSSVWNTFSVPAMAGMIYAMAGMETQLQGVMNKEGVFRGLSGHYSGSGFSRMTFAVNSTSQQGFDEWVARAKASGTALDRAGYLKLEKPSEQEPVRYYASVEDKLFDAILGLCARPGKMCVKEMHHIDRTGGAGVNSQGNRDRLEYDALRLREGHEELGATVPASGAPARDPNVQPEGMRPDPLSPGARPPPGPHGHHSPASPSGSQAQPGEPGSKRINPAPPQLTVSPRS